MLNFEQLSQHFYCRGVQVAIGLGAASVLTVFALKIKENSRLSALRKKWNNAGKDVVVLHQFDRARSCPNPSPYPIKLETFLRMHNIKYVNDFDEPMSTKQKSPWITFNGEDVADSQLAMEFLARKLNLDLNPGLDDEQKAISRGMRFMMEQDFYWALIYDRWVLNRGQLVADLFPPFAGNAWVNKSILKYYSGMVDKQVYAQGMSRHTTQEVEQMGIEDLKALSTLLGSKPFMMGNAPTELDAVVFGFMCMVLYCSPKSSPYRQKAEKDLKNLVEHTDRMIAKYWPDWEDARYKS